MLESDWLGGAETVRKITTAERVRARMDNKHCNKTPKSSKRGLGFDFLVWFFALFKSLTVSFLVGCQSTAKAVAVLNPIPQCRFLMVVRPQKHFSLVARDKLVMWDFTYDRTIIKLTARFVPRWYRILLLQPALRVPVMQTKLDGSF
jgi:hypothetical protein